MLCQCALLRAPALAGAASIGMSTMVEEYFGINIVEFMVRVPCSVFRWQFLSFEYLTAEQSAPTI